MADIAGVIFPNGTKTYYFDPAGLELSRGDRVVVQTANGPEIGQVVEANRTIDDSELPAPLKKVTRLATGRISRRRPLRRTCASRPWRRAGR